MPNSQQKITGNAGYFSPGSVVGLIFKSTIRERKPDSFSVRKCGFLLPQATCNWKKIKYRVWQCVIFIIFSLACIQSGNTNHYAPDCKPPPERQFIDAIFNQDFEDAREILKDIESDQSLIPSRPFYEALINWIAALSNNDSSQRKSKLSTLQKRVNDLSALHSTKQTPGSLLAWGLAEAHTARILLFEKRMITGYFTGNRAIKNLQQYVGDESSTDNGRNAAMLAIGLHQIYSNAIPDELKWATPFINQVGDMDHGRELIIHALQNSQHLSPEAARILLLEVPWATPGICDYLDLSRVLAKHYRNNPDFSLAHQGVSLRCGRPRDTLKENKRFMRIRSGQLITGLTEANYSELFQMGRLRAYADTGNVDAIRHESLVSVTLKPFQQLALANALDNSGSRDNAIAQYQSLSEDKSASISLRKVSKMRIRFPYSAVKRIVPGRSLSLALCE